MNLRKETFIEKALSPIVIVIICFLGFMAYIYVYVKKLAEPDLNILISCVILLSGLLMFRSFIRKIYKTGRRFSINSKSLLPTPDAVIERQQKQKDADAKYFGTIIFILSVMYIVFIEVS